MPTVSSLADAATVLVEADRSGRTVSLAQDLDLAGFDAIVEYEPGDLTCVVESGIRLSLLAATLAVEGQRLALDPPGDPTIGECIALNLSGPLRHRFGPPRDHVLGATLVLADGTIVNAGGKVVKNVAGYDLARLMCGARGELAFVGRVALRLHPLPESQATLTVESRNVARVARLLLNSQLQPSALDILHPGRVAVLFEGRRQAVEAQLQAALALVGGDRGADEVWTEARERQGTASGRLRFAPGDLQRALGRAAEAVVRPAAGIAYVPFAVPDGRSAGELRLAASLKAELDPRGTLTC